VILVVDDEATVRNLLRRWLEKAGHEVEEADSAEAAVTRLETLAPNVVFTDIQMPGHDGIWLTTELRKRYPSIAVILATGVSTIAANVSMQAGVLAYLVKPFEERSVIAALGRALAWQTEIVRAGAPTDNDPDRLRKWLESIT